MLTINNGTYLYMYTFLTLALCGTAQYFTGVGAILWLPFLLAIGMVGLTFIQTSHSKLMLDKHELSILVLLTGFFALSLSSTSLQVGVKETIIGFKNQFALALVLFCLLLGFCRESQIYKVVKLFYFIFYIQWPIIAFQLLVMVPRRVARYGDYEKWDSVVGTFGGDPFGGGNSAVMGLFCLLIMLLKVSEYKHGLTTKLSVALHVLSGFVLCVLGEIKFVILIAPLLLAYVWIAPSYLRDIKSYSIAIIIPLMIPLSLLILAAVYVLGSSYIVNLGMDPDTSPFMAFWKSIDYIFDPDFIVPTDDGFGELGRMTTVFFWLKNSQVYGITGQLFGYGLNTTN